MPNDRAYALRSLPAVCGARCWVSGNVVRKHPDFIAECARPLGHEGQHGALVPAAPMAGPAYAPHLTVVWMPWGDPALDPDQPPPMPVEAP